MNYPIRDAVPFAVSTCTKTLRAVLSTAASRILAKWWGITLGPSARFYGVPILQRHPRGTILIGAGATFRSSEWSNTIGINRRCVVAADRNAVIQIGTQCGFSGTVIAASKAITIGNRVLCGGNCTIVDTDRHPLDPIARSKHWPVASSPIVIEDDVFLGMNVVVLKGCMIGKGTVVAANSVVIHSVPAGVLAGGVPARVIKRLDNSK